VSAAYVDGRVLISADGYEQRCRDLDVLRNEARVELAERLREARQDGDLADNPALHDVLEEQAQLERRIAQLEAQLAAATIVAPTADGRAGIGSVVRVRDLDGNIAEYELVGPLESDADSGRVSITAPVGRALVGRRGGARVEVATPRGPLGLKVICVRPGATLAEDDASLPCCRPEVAGSIPARSVASFTRARAAPPRRTA
jgi:transcription elongation factor GreA